MNIIEAIRHRTSVRNFSGNHLSVAQTHMIEAAIADARSPFGGDVTITLKAFDTEGPRRPGTYGVITRATQYLLMATGDDEASLLSAGYIMEQVILRATMEGLGTCWVGGTFKGGDFDRGNNWPARERLRIIVPVGEPATHRSLLARVARLALGSRHRKPFGKLFFNRSFDTPLDPGDTGFPFSLEMLRLAPSSVNSQPWRAVVDGETVHFYYKSRGDMSVIDCGIALCHFHLAERHQQRDGYFFKDNNCGNPPAGLLYIMSYRNN